MVPYTWLKEEVPKEILIKQVYGIICSPAGNILLRIENDKYKLTGGKLETSDKDFSVTLRRGYLKRL